MRFIVFLLPLLLFMLLHGFEVDRTSASHLQFIYEKCRFFLFKITSHSFSFWVITKAQQFPFFLPFLLFLLLLLTMWFVFKQIDDCDFKILMWCCVNVTKSNQFKVRFN